MNLIVCVSVCAFGRVCVCVHLVECECVCAFGRVYVCVSAFGRVCECVCVRASARIPGFCLALPDLFIS